METVRSGFTLKLRHRGRSSEARDQSSLALTVFSFFLSFSLLSPSLSLVSIILVFDRSSSVSWFTVYGWWREEGREGGRGSGWAGLLECWHFQSGQQFFITAFLQDSTMASSTFHSLTRISKAPPTSWEWPLVAGWGHYTRRRKKQKIYIKSCWFHLQSLVSQFCLWGLQPAHNTRCLLILD